MSAALERTKEVLNDPMSAMSEKVYMLGHLAVALIGTNADDETAQEARAVIVAFWREMEEAQ